VLLIALRAPLRLAFDAAYRATAPALTLIAVPLSGVGVLHGCLCALARRCTLFTVYHRSGKTTTLMNNDRTAFCRLSTAFSCCQAILASSPRGGDMSSRGEGVQNAAYVGLAGDGWAADGGVSVTNAVFAARVCRVPARPPGVL